MPPKSRERQIVETFQPFMWYGKTADQLTDDQCKEVLRYLYEQTGKLYYLRGGYND